MAIPFNPPDWLIRDYFSRPRPQDVLGEQLVEMTQRQRMLSQRDKEMALRAQEEQRLGRNAFYAYGDPSGLTPEQQSALDPVQGPVDQQGTQPQISPVLQYFKEFHEQYPQGIMGGRIQAQKEIKENKPQDTKRTYQLKGFLDTENGKVPISYDTRTGQLVQGEATQGTILPIVSPSIPGAEVSKLGELENLKSKMKVVRDSYDPSFVGMIDSKVQAVKQRTGFGASEKSARFRQATQDIKDSLLRARSGAQINEQEYQRLLPLIPNEAMSEVDFLAKANRFNEVLDEMISSKKKAFSGAGYRQMKSGSSSETPEQRKARLLQELSVAQ